MWGGVKHWKKIIYHFQTIGLLLDGLKLVLILFELLVFGFILIIEIIKRVENKIKRGIHIKGAIWGIQSYLFKLLKSDKLILYY